MNADYDYQAELAEGRSNLARIEARRQEMQAMRAKYAYADTAAYAAACEGAQR